MNQGYSLQHTRTVIDKRREIAIEELQSNICSLLGVAVFRCDPSNPQEALHRLQKGYRDHPNCLNLAICLGEVMSAAGDMVGALEAFKKASEIDPFHPLPFLNAARTYQQLNQVEFSCTQLFVVLILVHG